MMRNTIPILTILVAAGATKAQYSTDWISTFNNLSGYNSAEDLLLTDSGKIYANGVFTQVNTGDAFIIGYANDGTELWRNGLPDSIGRAWKIFLLNDGTLLSLGDFEDQSGTNDVIAQRFDTLGGLLGNTVLNSPGFATGDDFADAVMDGSGRIYLTGTFMQSGQFRPGLARLDATGMLDWWQTYPLQANWNGLGKALAVELIDDSLAVVWTRNGSSYTAALGYDSAGNHLWTTDLMMSTEDNNKAMATDGLGHVLVGGRRNQMFNVTQLDAAGNVVWSTDLSYPGLNTVSATIRHVSCDANGDVYAVGEGSYQQGIPGPYYLLAKLSRNGHVLWTDTLNGGAINYCLNLDYALLHGDRWTIATAYIHSRLYEYDTTGTRLLHMNWNVPGAQLSNVNAMTTDGSGALFLAGRARLAGSAGDGFIAKLNPISTSINDPLIGPSAPYPDPVNDVLFLPGLPDSGSMVQVLDPTGRVVQRTTVNGTLDVRALPAGIYWVSAVGSTYGKRFVKQ